MKPDPYIGFAKVCERHIDLPRSTWLKYATEDLIFGPFVRVGAKNAVMVRESRVKAWVAGGCRPTTAQLVNDHE